MKIIQENQMMAPTTNLVSENSASLMSVSQIGKRKHLLIYHYLRESGWNVSLLNFIKDCLLEIAKCV